MSLLLYFLEDKYQLKFTQNIVLEKLRKYCAYQDRCHQEVRNKIISYKVYGDDLEEIINELIKDKFLNEERFARSYARGKFNFKKWGRNKIKYELQRRHVSSYCIRKGLEEIDEEVYLGTLREVINKQILKHKKHSQLIRRDKAIKYAASRGFEAPLIFKIIKEIELDY